MASAPRRFLGRVNLLCHPRARASFSLTRRAGAMRLDRIGPPGRCSGCRDALSYGVSFATTRSHQLARGAPAWFLSGISCLFSLSLAACVPNTLARRKWLRRRDAFWGALTCFVTLAREIGRASCRERV